MSIFDSFSTFKNAMTTKLANGVVFLANFPQKGASENDDPLGIHVIDDPDAPDRDLVDILNRKIRKSNACLEGTTFTFQAYSEKVLVPLTYLFLFAFEENAEIDFPHQLWLLAKVGRKQCPNPENVPCYHSGLDHINHWLKRALNQKAPVKREDFRNGLVVVRNLVAAIGEVRKGDNSQWWDEQVAEVLHATLRLEMDHRGVIEFVPHE